jgi:hypothetical protein
MPTKTIDLKDFSKELKKWTEKNAALVRQVSIDEVHAAIPRLVEKSPIDTGLYAQSWGTDIDEEAGLATIGNYAPHAGIIENGARPFTPPIKPLLAWAKRVLQDHSQPPNYSDDVWRLAKGTQKAIAERGLRPQHIMENEIPVIMENILKKLRGTSE